MRSLPSDSPWVWSAREEVSANAGRRRWQPWSRSSSPPRGPGRARRSRRTRWELAAAARPSREGWLQSVLPTPPSPHPPLRPSSRLSSADPWTPQEVRASERALGPGERMRTVESRGEGGREVKAGGGPGAPAGGPPRKGEAAGPQGGGLLAEIKARWRRYCAPGGVHLQG